MPQSYVESKLVSHNPLESILVETLTLVQLHIKTAFEDTFVFHNAKY